MKITAVRPYAGPVGADGLVDVFDVTVRPCHTYRVHGVFVSNSKRISLLDTNALLAHGAVETLRDAGAVRGQRSEDYWLQLMQGRSPREVKVPVVYEKFVNTLKAAGVNVVRDGGRLHVMALTRKDVDALAGDRLVRNGETVRFDRDMEPVAGGLFDPKLTGGHGGTRWSAIRLPEPLPSPVMEEPIRRILGLTQKQYEAAIAGEHEIGQFGSGPQAVARALDNLNLEREIGVARAQMKSGSAQARDAAVRKLGYLKSAQKLGLHPRDWVLDKVPVLPPAFRPVSVLGDSGVPLVSDPNYLYRELMEAGKNFEDMRQAVGDDNVGNERLALYRAFKAVTGLADPVHPKLQEKRVKGLLAGIFGPTAKYGMVQRKLLSSTVDNVGRAVIVPEPDYDMDTIGLPEDKAFEVYSKFIVRRLRRRGLPVREALRQVKDRTDLARDMLVEEMEGRPVYVNRAPVLHKFGILAFRPRLVKGNVLRINPLVLKGFNADFDGNCCVFDTEVCIDLDVKRLCASEAGTTWLTLFQETHMRLTGKQFVCLPGAPYRSAVVPIGEFPRTGEPRKDRRGSLVYDVPAGVYIVSYDHVTGTVIRLPITHFTVDKGHECVEVITARKRKVEVSDNESLAVFDRETGALIKKRPTDSVGNLMPVVRKEPLTGDEFDYELGWWYGAFVSDGWAGKRTIGYAKNELEKRKEFVRIARKINPNFSCCEYAEAAGKTKYAASTKIHLNGKQLVAAVFDCYSEACEYRDGAERRSLYKKLPEELLARGSRQCLLGLLAGLLDGDGILAWNETKAKKRAVIKTHTSSKFLVEDLKRLARLLGLRYSVITSPAHDRSRESYVFCWSLCDMHAMGSELRFVGEKEQQWWAEFLSAKVEKDDIDIVPVVRAVAVKLADLCLSRQEKSLYVTWRKAIKTAAVTRQTALRTLEVVEKSGVEIAGLDAFRRVVENADVHWDVVRKVSRIGKRDVFDFAVPGTKVFMLNNGLVIYDTMQFHVPTLPEAVKEAYDRLLPSRSLISPADFKTPVHAPVEEDLLGGLYYATRKHKGRPARPAARVFRNAEDARKAWERGEITLKTEVHILET